MFGRGKTGMRSGIRHEKGSVVEQLGSRGMPHDSRWVPRMSTDCHVVSEGEK
jgi:hypothetical protein